jgi:hypothetical protein
MGGGNFVVPVQTVTDFLENRLSGRYIILFPKLFYTINFQIFISFILNGFVSNICATFKLSIRSEGSKSP